MTFAIKWTSLPPLLEIFSLFNNHILSNQRLSPTFWEVQCPDFLFFFFEWLCYNFGQMAIKQPNHIKWKTFHYFVDSMGWSGNIGTKFESSKQNKWLDLKREANICYKKYYWRALFNEQMFTSKPDFIHIQLKSETFYSITCNIKLS